MIGVRVKGGTGAGTRIVKERAPWTHDCEREQTVDGERLTWLDMRRVLPGHRYSCPDCGAKRP